MQIVHFNQSNSGGAVYTTHDRRVVACWQICDNRRFPSVTGCVTAVLDFLHLVMGDNPADDRRLPIIIAANQSARTIVQFQGWVLQWIGNTKLTELRSNGADNHSFWGRALNNEPSNHHIVTGLHKGARADIAQVRYRCAVKFKCANIRNSQTAIPALIPGWRSR